MSKEKYAVLSREGNFFRRGSFGVVVSVHSVEQFANITKRIRQINALNKDLLGERFAVKKVDASVKKGDRVRW